MVFRDIGSLSLLSDQSSENRLTALFTDLRYQPQQLAARMGRQTSTSGGVLGRFDGGALSWGFAPSWRAGVLAGTPSDPVLGERKQFVGATLDADDLVDGLGAGLFAIQQRTEGMLDRRAVGGELRYFTPKLTVFSLLDYDIEYGVLNVGSTQGILAVRHRRHPQLPLRLPAHARPCSSATRCWARPRSRCATCSTT